MRDAGKEDREFEGEGWRILEGNKLKERMESACKGSRKIVGRV